jgi:hypothetical protein
VVARPTLELLGKTPSFKTGNGKPNPTEYHKWSGFRKKARVGGVQYVHCLGIFDHVQIYVSQLLRVLTAKPNQGCDRNYNAN